MENTNGNNGNNENTENTTNTTNENQHSKAMLAKADFDRLPGNLKDLYHLLYKRIETMLAGRTLDIRTDLTLVKLIFEYTMQLVEKFKDENGQLLIGAEKKQYALLLISYIISDLRSNNKITEQTAQDLQFAIDMLGGVLMDVVLDAVNAVFDVGQKVTADIQQNGCRGCLRRNF